MTGPAGARRGSIDAARAIAAHLDLWLPAAPPDGTPGTGTYLTGYAADRGVTLAARHVLPTAVTSGRVFRQRAEDREPYLRCVPGAVRVVDRDHETVTVEVAVEVFTIVRADSIDQGERLIAAYEDAIVACLEQQPVTGLDGVEWLGGQDGEEVVETEDERTRQGRVDVFVCRMNDALAPSAGPTSPDDPSLGGYVADDVIVDVDPMPYLEDEP